MERQDPIQDLLVSMERLDSLLRSAIDAARAAYGSEAASDPFRGFCITPSDVERILDREPGETLLHQEELQILSSHVDPAEETSRLAWLQRAFNLAPFDVDLLLIALAPELDLRYERLYAYLQDDVTRRRPTVELALSLLCPSPEAKLRLRSRLAPDAPLLRHRLLHLIPDSHQAAPPLLSHYLKPDEQIVALLLGETGLDHRLAGFCRMLHPATPLEDLPLSRDLKESLRSMVASARLERRPLRLYFHGPNGTGKRTAASALACDLSVPLLAADVARVPGNETDFEELVGLLFREAWFHDALLFIESVDDLRGSEEVRRRESLIAALAEDGGVTILAGKEPWVPRASRPAGVLPVAFPLPDFAQTCELWGIALDRAGYRVPDSDVQALAGRFRLTPAQIDDAVEAASTRARWRAAAEPDNDESQAEVQLSAEELFAAASVQTGQELASLAQRIEPVQRWEDLVLPEDTVELLREICSRVRHHHDVMDGWGFGRKLSLGKGVNALFSGPSGTGKTMAAEVIANDLRLDLFRIDLSGIVSKYIGETEKNLDRVFQAARNANAILFFDEADALFGKRSEVRDSHDRYANIEISYLLQKMEQYEGVAILATNLRGNLDEAFVRRLAFTVHFPFPDVESRLRIWKGIWPGGICLAEQLDFSLLARRFKLSGGNIKNVALAAAFLAAQDGRVVTMDHLLHATRREYQKMGKLLTEEELYGPMPEDRQPALTAGGKSESW